MRVATRRNADHRAVARTISVPAPIGGWNARDPLGDMDPKDAPILKNWWPLTTSVMARKGYTQYSTGLGAQVESIFSYSAPAGTQAMFGVAGDSIYDITSGGAVGAALVTGLTNSRFQYVNVTTAGGSFILAVNGADKLRGYTGSAWYADGDTSHDISGLDTSTCNNIGLHKSRVWFTVGTTLKAWYLGSGAISGAANALDLSAVCRKGGHLVAVGTWTIDAGYGVDDLIVFASSVGEIVVYRGTDPSSSTTWALVGVWQLGSPLGLRCMHKYAGDLVIITQDGVLPLSGALQSSRLNPRVALSDKIQQAVSTATGTYSSNFGWQVLYYPGANMLIVNVPVSEGSLQEQWCMNTITQSWAQFQGMTANCWEIFNNNLFFGANGYVGKAWNGFADNGSSVASDVQQAFGYFGARGQLKQWLEVRPMLRTNGAPSVLVGLNVDFDDTPPSASLTIAATSYAVWDTAVWDTDIWGGGLSSVNQWQGVSGIGTSAAMRMLTAVNGIQLEWVATDFLYQPGAFIG